MGGKPVIPTKQVDALTKPAEPLADPVAMLLHVASVAAPRPAVRPRLGVARPVLAALRMAVALVEAISPTVGPAVPTRKVVGVDDAREAIELRPVPAPGRAFAARAEVEPRLTPMGAPALGPAAALHEAAVPLVAEALMVGEGPPTPVHVVGHPSVIQPTPVAGALTKGPPLVAAA